MKAGAFRRGTILAVALSLGALGGCADSSKTTQSQQPGANASSDTSPAGIKARISRICMTDPGKYFGEGAATTQARCDCYGDGITKRLTKDQLSYVATYNEIPFNSAEEYEPIKQSCVAGGVAPDPEKKSKKKAASADKDKS